MEFRSVLSCLSWVLMYEVEKYFFDTDDPKPTKISQSNRYAKLNAAELTVKVVFSDWCKSHSILRRMSSNGIGPKMSAGSSFAGSP